MSDQPQPHPIPVQTRHMIVEHGDARVCHCVQVSDPRTHGVYDKSTHVVVSKEMADRAFREYQEAHHLSCNEGEDYRAYQKLDDFMCDLLAHMDLEAIDGE